MRSLLPFLFLLLSSTGLMAQREQPRALFDSVSFSGGFFGLSLRYTEVMGNSASLFGLGGGIVVKNRLNIGLAGVFSTSVLKNRDYERYLNDSLGVNTQGGLEFSFGYGGLLIEPVIFHRSAVHLTVPVLIGMGGASYGYPLPGSDGSNRQSKVAGQAYFALEPGIEMGITIIRGLRIGLGGSYLFTSDLDLPGTKPDALRVPMYRLTLKYAAP